MMELKKKIHQNSSTPSLKNGVCAHAHAHAHAHTHTPPSTRPLTWQHDIKSLVRREQIDGSTVR